MIPSSSPLDQSSNVSPFSSTPLNPSVGPTYTSSSSLFGGLPPPVGPPFAMAANTKGLSGSPSPYSPWSNSLGFFRPSSSTTGNPSSNSFSGFQVPASGSSPSSTSTPVFGRPLFNFTGPSSASSSVFSQMSGFPQSSFSPANAGGYSLFRNQQSQPSLFGNQQSQPLLFGNQQSQHSLFANQQSQPLLFRNQQSQPSVFGNQQSQPTVGPTPARFGVSRPDTSSSSSTSSVSGQATCGPTIVPPVPSEFGQVRGTRIAQYVPTDSLDPPFILMSISAMFPYSHKSHEELRLEDYQLGNTGVSSSRCTTCKCFQSGVVSQPNQTFNQASNQFGPLQNGPGPTSSTLNQTFNQPANQSGPLNGPGPTSSILNQALNQPANQFGPLQNRPGPTSSTLNQTFNQASNQFGPLLNGPGPTSSSTLLGPYQGPSVGFIAQPFGVGTASLGSSDAVFGAPQLIPVVMWVPVYGFPEVLRGAHVGPGGHNGKEKQPDTDNGANDLNTVEKSLSEVKIKGKEKVDFVVPEGLRGLIEKLGFNPWAEGKIEEDESLGLTLAVEEADKDEDVSAFAQFAVDQHNAMTEEGKVELVGVVAASVEPVKGGRYHIVLEARDASANTDVEPKKYYAWVLRGTSHHLAVLEKWLPGKKCS